MELVGKITTVLVALVATALIRGLVLVVMWSWYVEQLGVRSINVAEAIGLAMIFGMLNQREADDPSKDQRDFMEKFAFNLSTSIVGAGFVFVFGWIFHFFV